MSCELTRLMDYPRTKILFSLLYSAISGVQMSETELMDCSVELIPDLLKIAIKHDVANLLAWGLKQNTIKIKDEGNIQKHILMSAYRCERLQYEYENLCQILEQRKIQFLPLKGAIIRKFYPEAWMRTSSDIDILVREEDVEIAKSLLIDEYGYNYYVKGSHDISLISPSGIHIELHYDLVENGVANKASIVLSNVWNMVNRCDGFDFLYEMPDNLFYFYHIAHMAKHFEYGGCGIRSIIDLWILDNIELVDIAKRDKLLQEGELLTFANVVRKLSRVWFAGEEHDNVTRQMEEYILRGGVYGTSTNCIMVQQQKKGGKIKYALSKIFIQYDVIKFQYPILQKHRWLTPLMEVRRWCKLIFCGHLRRVTRELKYNSNISNSEATNTQKFLCDIGLHI